MQGNNIKRQLLRGFTLMEIAVSITILGLLARGFIVNYTNYEKQQQFKQEIAGVQGAAWAIVAYRSIYNSYPCPAPINIPRTDPKYGYASDCTSAAVAPGTCGAAGATGYCVANSTRIPALTNPRIRTGTIPFRTLNMPENVAIDAYGDEIMYAVTEAQAQGLAYNPTIGGISVIDGSGAGHTRIQPPNSGDYVVYSLGPDRAGAYARGGIPSGVACDPATTEWDNCAFSAGTPTAIFREVSYNTAGTTKQMDDILVHYIPMAPTLWARNQASPADIYGVNQVGTTGKAGEDFNFNVNLTLNPAAYPTARLQVNGNTLIVGKTSANQYCDVNDANCFPAGMIAGTTGSQCPTQFLTGIANATSVCSNGTLTVTCGFSGGGVPLVLQTLQNGKLGCQHMSCLAATRIGSCGGGSYSLAESPHGTILGPFTTACMNDSFKCKDGNWIDTPSGFCCQSAWSHTATCPDGTDTYTFGRTADDCTACIQGSAFNNSGTCPAPAPAPAPSPAPAPAPSPGPSPGPSPAPAPGPSPAPAPGPSPAPGPGPSPGPSPAPGPGPSPGPSPAPAPGPSPAPAPGPAPSPGSGGTGGFGG